MTSTLSTVQGSGPSSSGDGSATSVEFAGVSSPVRRCCWIPSSAVDADDADAPFHRLPNLDENEQRCWQAFLDSSTLLLGKVNRRLLERHQLTVFEFLVLDALAKSAGGSARMGDLAHATVLAPSRLTELARRMESQGL